MSKNKKNASSANANNVKRAVRHYPIDMPTVMSIDVLGILPEEDLLGRVRTLEDDRQKLLENQYDVQPWEEEIAYIRRELQLRKVRRDLHDAYLSNLKDDLYCDHQDQNLFEKEKSQSELN